MRTPAAASTAVLIGLMLVLSPGAAVALDFMVDSTADAVDASPGDGVCAAATMPPACTLRAAIMEANATPDLDRVFLEAETYTLTLTGSDEDLCATGDLDIREPIEISGVGASQTAVDANGIDRVFQTIGLDTGEAATLYDLTITGGAATSLSSYSGGGVLAVGGILWLVRAQVSDNSANTGGGVFLASSSGVVINSTISGNALIPVGATNMFGSAILVKGSGTLLNLDSSTVTGNTGGQQAVTGNQGGGLLVRNSTISGNDGVGVRNYNGDLEVVNSTVVGNGLDGISFGSFDDTDTVTVYNTIVADHTRPGYGNCYISSGVYVHAGNLESGHSCGFGVDELSDTDPVLGPLAANGGPTLTHRPLPGSPAIDAGADGSPYCRAFDQRGLGRPVDGDADGAARCDIGAVETGELIFADGFESGDWFEWD